MHTWHYVDKSINLLLCVALWCRKIIQIKHGRRFLMCKIKCSVVAADGSADGVSMITDLRYNLHQKLDNVSASVMRRRHLISNTKYATGILGNIVSIREGEIPQKNWGVPTVYGSTAWFYISVIFCEKCWWKLAEISSSHSITMSWVWWCVKSLATRLFVAHFVQADIN